ncbi:MAG: GAF domain-containing protein [Burkholderiales bacterium]|nr:GAF domain-containing protein [Burkholderiales bacterium]
MADSPADVRIVLNAIAKQAARLCRAPFARVTALQDGVLRPLGGYAVRGITPLAVDFPARRTSIQGRALLDRKTLHFDDVAPLLEREFPDARENARILGFRAVLAVPLMRGNEALGAMFLYRREPGLFAPDQVALVETFARQAAIALDNVRQFHATREALEQQTATSEILRVISNSTTDAKPVFESIAQAALKLCHGVSSTLHTYDGRLLHIGALASTTSEGAEAVRAVFPRPASRDLGVTRAVLTRDLVEIPDILLDPDYTPKEQALAASFRSVLAVPLMQDGEPIGAISVGRPEAGAFPASQVALLQTFADQAVIAIENVRLFTELGDRNRDLTEALEHQTATSDILRVISSSPTDAQPVFATIADRAVALCGSDVSLVSRVDGELIQLAAVHGITQDERERLAQIFPLLLDHGSATAAAVRNRGVAHIADVRADPAYDPKAAAVGAWRSALAVPMLREGQVIGTIFVGRHAPGLFPNTKVELLKTFADQAVIAIENVRLFTELQARNRDLTEALEQQTATSEILRVISRSQTDVQPVFDTIANSVLALCRAQFANVFTYDGELIHLAAYVNVHDEFIDTMREHYPMKPGRATAVARAVATGRVTIIEDVLADPDYTMAAAAAVGGFRSILAVPLLREGKGIGGIAIGRPDPGTFPDSQIALLRTFADQAVIAIENVRLFTELEARNRDLTTAFERQTATGEVLRVISSSPTDTQPVFDAIVRSAVALCHAQHALIFDFDGQVLRPVAQHSVEREFAEYWRRNPPRPGPGSVAGRATLERKTVHVHDVLSLPDYEHSEAQQFQHFRTVLAVPMLRDETVRGVLAMWRVEVAPFSPQEIGLVETFADQAVIAIENVRLFTELQARNRDLTEALEQQTATSEILRVISRSQTDVQPVFETIVNSVLALCDAQFSGVYLLEGHTVHLAATAGLNDEELAAFRAGYPRKVGNDTVSGLAALESRVVQTLDLLNDPQYAGAPGTRVGARTVLGVPLLRDGGSIGSIGVWRAESKAFSDTQIALLQTFADQAVIAIENVRLFKELEARTAQLTRSVSELQALGEVGQAVSSTLDVETVLGTIVARVTKLTGMDGVSIYEYDEAKEEFLLHSANGLPIEVVEALRSAPMRKGEGALGRMAITGQPVEIRDIGDERAYQSRVRNTLMRLGLRSLLVVPLLRESHLLGGLAVNRRGTGAFDESVVELMKTFATQSAIAIQNARLFREIQHKSRELESASRHKSEFLANMSHELRTPLNAIIGFSEVLGERLFGELNDKQGEYVADIADSGRHLLSLINDILDLSKIEAGRMELEPADFDLPKAIGQALSLVRERAERRAIEVSLAVDPAVTTIRADERKVKQVILNLLSNALKFTPQGGRITVAAVSHPDKVEVSVRDTGVGIAPEDHEKVFEEFRQVGTSEARTEGTGLGLAISRKFIELHGGKLWVASGLGKGSTFTFSLPRR